MDTRPLMSLVANHDFSPSSGEWPGTLIDHQFDCMNGIKRTVIAELQRPIIRDAVCETLLHEAGAELSKAQMNEVNNHLLGIVIISAAHETGSLPELSRSPSHHLTAPPLGHTCP